MRLKYIIPFFIAAVGAVFTGCSDDKDPTYLDGLRVSQSYVALPANGGSTSITVNAADSWSIDDASIPEWLSVSPKSGGAGEGTINFSVEGSEEARNCELLLKSAGLVQRLNVLQYVEEKDPVYLSVAEAVAMIKANTQGTKAHYVKGIVCRINEISPSYGNATFFISDDGTFQDGNWLEIYRGKWLNGANYTTGDEFAVGDEMVIKGILVDYNGTPETSQGASEVVSVTKSLLKCDSLMIGGEAGDTMPLEGGEIVAHLTCKGTGVAVEIPAEAQSWLGVVSSTIGENPTVTFRVAPNDGDSRSTTVVFKTTDGKKTYTAQATIKQQAFKLPKGKNPSDPFSVAEAIAKCQEIGATTDGEIYYAKGKISSIKEVSTSYGNATFNISDDGSDDNALTCFRSFSLDNQKFASEDEIAVGDEVIVCGKLVNYTKDGVVTPEFSGNVYIYSLKKGSGAGGNDGSLAKPYTVKEITALAAELAENETSKADYYFKGKISNIKFTFSAQYGTATFFISDDGTAADEFQIYSALYYGGQSWVEGNTQIAVGDEVVIYGKICNYKGTLETASKKAYVYSINGKTE